MTEPIPISAIERDRAHRVQKLCLQRTRGLLSRHAAALATIFVMAFAAPSPVRADEPLFGFTYTTDLLPKGKFEVEQWSTTRISKATGSFWQQENRTELEYGVNDLFQFSLYTNYDSTAAYHSGPFGATTPGEPFSYDVPGPNDHYRRSRFIGISGEAIYRLLSPYTHPVGVALYFEPTIGPGFIEPEARLILQKNFRDDRLVLGFNFTYAPEYRRLPPDTSCMCLAETDVNADFGLSYRFRRNWSAGFEFFNERELNSLNFTHEINSAYYVGPTIHYGGKHFFVTATFVGQLPWATTHSDTQPGAIVGGRDYDNDFEKYRVRVKFGWYFGGKEKK